MPDALPVTPSPNQQHQSNEGINSLIN